jgi:predicted TIM-barrel fold metal-dependent hydrolase
MDEKWEIRGELETPGLKRKPSTAVKERPWYFHTEAEEQMLPYFISVMGDDKVFFASDFPHWDGDYPANLDYLLERTDLPEESKRKVMGENARRLYLL